MIFPILSIARFLSFAHIQMKMIPCSRACWALPVLHQHHILDDHRDHYRRHDMTGRSRIPASCIDIINHHIRCSSCLMKEMDERIEERSTWLTENGDRYPLYVAFTGDKVVGWGIFPSFLTKCLPLHRSRCSLRSSRPQVAGPAKYLLRG